MAEDFKKSEIVQEVKKDKTLLIFLLVPVILITAVLIYIFSPGDGGRTGGEVLKTMPVIWWLGAVAGLILAAVAFVAAGRIERDSPKRTVNLPRALLFAGLLLLCLPFIRACNEKADDNKNDTFKTQSMQK